MKGRFSLFAVAFLLAGVAAPALAQAEDDALTNSARELGNSMAGARTGGEVPADKAISITRENGQVFVTGMFALTPNQWVDPPEGSVAMLRTRAVTSGNNGPEPADLDYAQRTGLRIFIVGEWASPPLIWEVVGDEAQVRMRDIDGEGRAGPWRTLAR